MYEVVSVGRLNAKKQPYIGEVQSIAHAKIRSTPSNLLQIETLRTALCSKVKEKVAGKHWSALTGSPESSWHQEFRILKLILSHTRTRTSGSREVR